MYFGVHTSSAVESFCGAIDAMTVLQVSPEAWIQKNRKSPSRSMSSKTNGNSTGRSKNSKRSKTNPSPKVTVTGSSDENSLGDWFCAPASALACDPVLASNERNDEVLAASVLAYERGTRIQVLDEPLMKRGRLPGYRLIVLGVLGE